MVFKSGMNGGAVYSNYSETQIDSYDSVILGAIIF
jgi:hypothetical protein